MKVVWKEVKQTPMPKYYDPVEIAEDVLKDADEWLAILHQSQCETFPDNEWDSLVRSLTSLRNVAKKVKHSLKLQTKASARAS